MRKIVMVIVLVMCMFVGSGYAGEYSKSFVKAKAKYEKKIKEIEDKAQKEKTKEIEKVLKEYKKEIKKCSKSGKVDESNELNDEMKDLMAQKNLNVAELKEMLVASEWTHRWKDGGERAISFDKEGNVVASEGWEKKWKITNDLILQLFDKKNKLICDFEYDVGRKTWNYIENKSAIVNDDEKRIVKD